MPLTWFQVEEREHGYQVWASITDKFNYIICSNKPNHYTATWKTNDDMESDDFFYFSHYIKTLDDAKNICQKHYNEWILKYHSNEHSDITN